MRCESAVKGVSLFIGAVLWVAAVTADRVRIEIADSTEVAVEVYFAERLPALMFLRHTDPKYLVIGFEPFEPAEGVLYPSGGTGFLTELSLKREDRWVLLRARSERPFKHKVGYSNDEKRYRVVLVAEGEAALAAGPAEREREPAPASAKPGARAPEPPRADRFELQEVLFEETTMVLVFRGDPPPGFQQKALPLEAEALQIVFPDVTVEPVGDLATRTDGARCQREDDGTSCTIFLRSAPSLTAKMGVRMAGAPVVTEASVTPVPQEEPQEPTPMERELPAPSVSAEKVEEKPAEAQAEARVPPAEAALVQSTETGEPPDEAKPEEPKPVEGVPEAVAVIVAEPEMPEPEGEAPVARPSEAVEAEKPAELEPKPAEPEPAEAKPEAAAPEVPADSRESVPPEVPAEPAAAAEPALPIPAPAEPAPPEKAEQPPTGLALENPWTASLQGDLKKVTYERGPVESSVRLSFAKAPDFVARARVAEVLVTALDVASEVLTREFGEGPVSGMDISPDLSGVRVIIRIREGFEASLAAAGNDLVLRLTRRPGGIMAPAPPTK
jgi:hypothetical protein